MRIEISALTKEQEEALKPVDGMIRESDYKVYMNGEWEDIGLKSKVERDEDE